MATVNNPAGGSVNYIGPGSVVSGSVVAGRLSWPADHGLADERRWRVWVDHTPVTSPLAAPAAADEFMYQATRRPGGYVEIRPEGGEQW